MSKVQNNDCQFAAIEPKVAWAIKARRYLGLLKKELFEEAVELAKFEPFIQLFLYHFGKGDFYETGILHEELVSQFHASGRDEEALTIKLFYLERKSDFVENFFDLPNEQQKQLGEKANQACEEAIQIAELLGDKLCQAAYLQKLASNLKHTGQAEKAEDCCNSALAVYQELSIAEPNVFKQIVAGTFNRLGNLQRDLQNFSDSEKSHSKALQIYRELSKAEPTIFNWSAAITLGYLCHVQLKLKKFNEAEKSHLDALQIYRELENAEPNKFKGDLAATLRDLGDLQHKLKKYAEAEISYSESLQIYRDLAKEKSPTNNLQIALLLENLGNLQSDWSNLEGLSGEQRKLILKRAESSYSEALPIYEEYDRDDCCDYDEIMTAFRNNLDNARSRIREIERNDE